ncbi:MAG: efflux RND transporter periplasmic adaptor subunit [Proteobacteria bacterium]|nr:efflux RND transporter periplasmic adaptor subunit [Pseudomonadota bacterium]
MIRDTSAQDRPIAQRSSTPRRVAIVVVAVLVIGGALLAWPALQRTLSTGQSYSAARLVIADVERGPFVRDIAGEGKVVAAVSPTLYAPGSGTVALQVHAGDRVTKGQVLAVIDSPDLNAKLAQERSNADALQADAQRADVDAREQRAALQATVDNARIDRTTAENDLARQQKAFDAGAAAGMQVDHAKDALQKAGIALDHATSGLKLKDDSLRFDVQAKRLAHERQLLLVKDLMRQVEALTVRSPVDGQVGQLFVAEHASVARDAQLLSVVDLSALEVQMQVAESFARDLAIGMPGEIGGNGQTWKGLVSAVSPEVVNNEVSARLRFDGATPAQLRQNQRLSVRVLLDKRDDVVTVRRGSFVDESGGAYAYVVRDGIAEKTPIKVGARSLDRVEILSGLKPGDRVVVTGADAFQGAPRVALSP